MNEEKDRMFDEQNSSTDVDNTAQSNGNTNTYEPNFTLQEPVAASQDTETMEERVKAETAQQFTSAQSQPQMQQSAGYVGNNSSQRGNQYNFWQQQTGGSYTNANNYQQSTYPYGNMSGMSSGATQKKDYKTLKTIGKALGAGVAAAFGFSLVLFGAGKLGIVDTTQIASTAGRNNGPAISTTSVITSGGAVGQSDLTSVVDKCMPSIVSINSTVTSTYYSFYGTYDEDSTGSGSGIILKMSDDEILIATNNHVIADAKEISVGFYGMESEEDMVKAVVKGTDSTNDLAVVLVKTKDVPDDIRKQISAIQIGSSDDAKVGEQVIAIGNALGYGQSMTVGYISAKDRKVQVDENTTMTLLQTDAAINPGNSGGALLNGDGELIGINSAKYSDTSVEGMGFAIPISDAVSIINELMDREVLTDEEKGYLGISGTNITEEVQQQYPNMPKGVYVRQVSEDGAAVEAGIAVGDIIVGIGDDEVLTIEELAEKVNSYRIGTKITLKVKRMKDGKYVNKKITVTLKGKETIESMDGSSDSDTKDSKNSDNGNSREQDDSQSNNGNQMNPYGNNDEDLQQYYNYFFGN